MKLLSRGYWRSLLPAQLLLIMRITAILLIAALHVSATGRSQTVTYSGKNVRLEQVFAAIEQQTGYGFFYKLPDLKNARPVSLDLKNVPLQDALEKILQDQSLGFSIQGTTIVITFKTPTATLQPAASILSSSSPPPVDIHGRVTDSLGNPLPGVSVTVKGSKIFVATDANGEFSLTNIPSNATIVVTHIGFEKTEFKLKGESELSFTLKIAARDLGNVEVTYSSGYQNIPKERATGSFDLVDNALINRSVSTNILDRIDGVAGGVLFNKNIITSANQSSIAIRGRSTISSNPNPLIILDNFPYDGDLSTINPNDVENITILKDAAAASIWGSFSGNGVIVITTKKGRYDHPLEISVNANWTIGNKPDLWYTPQISSSDFIDLQTYLYGKGFYNGALSTNYGFVPPVPNILSESNMGIISPADAQTRIDALRSLDVRNDISKYYYRKSLNQQYSINLRGGGQDQQYYFSAGLDKNRPNMTGNRYQRLTLDASNTYSMFHQKLDWTVDLSFQRSNTTTNNTGYNSPYPYAQLADGAGNPLAVNQYRQSYLDTAGQGLLLDWNDRPLDELKLADNTSTLTNYRFNTGLKYKWQHGLDINLFYQYSGGNTETDNYQSQQTYYTRNLINSFSQIDFSSGTVTYPVPLGGILNLATSSYQSNNLRGQLNYSHAWRDEGRLNFIAGTEIRSITTQARSSALYGYDKTLQQSALVDYVDFFPDYIHPYQSATISSNISNLETINRYFSYFANAAYSYRLKYTLSGSFRRDESNLFGVNANQKGVPLWSAGTAWEISRENFYHISALPYLRLRITEGYNGNINNSVSAYTTASASPFPNNFNAPFQTILNPPNPSLRWERVNIVNFGLDFGLRNKRLDGSIEYYRKNGEDLIGQSPVAPQTGVPVFTGNTADMKGNGLDLTLNTVNVIHRSFMWMTNFLFSFTQDKISVYKKATGALYLYMNAGTLNPLVGHPLYSIYGYKSLGLDSAGNPQGILAGKTSENYGAIANSSDFNDVRYMGSANPTIFGSLRNTFVQGPFSLSFNITYKLGYYFRRPSLNEYQLISLANVQGGDDYGKRWQKPGDEKITRVPSLVYPVNNSRSDFYTYSQDLIEKGDHIRLKDIQFSYDITKKQWSKMPGQSIRLYLYASNIGILWRANKEGLDPDYVPNYNNLVVPDPRTLSAGIKINL
jgi:TonB-linked SusC/RagA family outer membrane protein